MKIPEALRNIKNEVEVPNAKGMALNNRELGKVTGGTSEGELHFAAGYVCPFCNQEHHVGFTDLVGNDLISNRVPCGKGIVEWVKNYSSSQTLCLRNTKTGKPIVIYFELIVVASL